MIHALAALLGGLSWTLAEYLLHRLDGHGMRGRTRSSRLHLAHHTRPDTFAPARLKVQAAIGVTIPMTSLGLWLAGPAGVAFTAGFVSAYLLYEWLHRRLHTHPPRTAWGRWARRHHFLHHFHRPHLNHGVTSPLWDHVFGTHLGGAPVVVPRRHAPPWMLTGDGQVRPELAGLFELQGRAPQPGPRPRPGVAAG
ncbi:MAG TPA: hypothetical protein ENK18_15425, partial [Deltaproteobacteria bacterium]|nr:hypothetical protein [Deltaproteobacteria bacterium]